MDRSFYLALAERGLRMPIGSDLVLRERSDAEAALADGNRLAEVIIAAARRYGSPLAFPVMDLTVEKQVLLEGLGVGGARHEQYHLDAVPDEVAAGRLRAYLAGEPHARLAAQAQAIDIIARQAPDLLPVGMSIGPFSLTSKLLADPITPVFLAGSGSTAGDEPEVALLEKCLELSLSVVTASIRLQCAAGAKAVFIAEPAGNVAYFSPNQLSGPGDVFDRFVVAPNLAVRTLLEELDADLLFHCCGELVDEMVRRYAGLDPAVLSLGSSRRLWEDAAIVPNTTVLFGNLPSKKFYSDELVTEAEVTVMADELVERMRAAGHPFILGSECDVLCVHGHEEPIRRKVAALVRGGKP